MNNTFITILAEKKTKSLGTRVRPTIHKLIKILSEKENLSVNELIEIMVLERYSEKLGG